MIIELLFRIFLVMVSLYLLLTFIVGCKLSTKIGILILIISILITVGIFLLVGLKHIYVCQCCNGVSIKTSLSNFKI